MPVTNPTIVVTGAGGALGRLVTDALLKRGVAVLGLGRDDPPQGFGAPYVKADLANGTTLAEALRGADVIVHTASDTTKKGADIQVARNLAQAAHQAGVKHIIYVQIAGIAEARKIFWYYENKTQAERVLRESPVPCSTASSTQFHHLAARIFATLSVGPLLFLPKFTFQPVDVSFFAERLAEHATQVAPAGITVCGPEALTSREMADQWLAAKTQRKLIFPIPAFGPIAGFAKLLPVAGSVGGLTWAAWLRRSVKSGSK